MKKFIRKHWLMLTLSFLLIGLAAEKHTRTFITSAVYIAYDSPILLTGINGIYYIIEQANYITVNTVK